MCQVLKAFSSCIMTKNKPTFKNRQLTSESFSVNILIFKQAKGQIPVDFLTLAFLTKIKYSFFI